MTTTVISIDSKAIKAAKDSFRSLAHLLHAADPDLLIQMAEDINADQCLLSALAYHPDTRIRSAVADNSSTPYSILLKLVRDESSDIRYQLAENHNLPLSVLLILSEDDNPYISSRADWTITRVNGLRKIA